LMPFSRGADRKKAPRGEFQGWGGYRGTEKRGGDFILERIFHISQNSSRVAFSGGKYEKYYMVPNIIRVKDKSFSSDSTGSEITQQRRGEERSSCSSESTANWGARTDRDGVGEWRKI